MTLETIYDGDGSDVTFNTNFDYLEQEDISVAVKPSGGTYAQKTLDTHYTVSGQVVTFTSGNTPPNNSKVRIRRHTPVTHPRHTHYAGSAITAKSLNENVNQILNALEERGLAVDDETDQPFTIGTHNEIKVNSATNLEVVAGKITNNHMAINSIDSDQYVDGSIDHVHLSADAIDGDNIANDSINSEHYVDASIDHQHLSNDCIDGDNIQDDVINSEHYAAASIDNEHLADDAVGIAELSASGTASSSTFLRGDNSWKTLIESAPAGFQIGFGYASTTTKKEFTEDNTWQDSGLEITYTPKSSSSLLLIEARPIIRARPDGDQRDAYFEVRYELDNSGNDLDGAMGFTYGHAAQHSDYAYYVATANQPMLITAVYTNSNTNQKIFKVQMRAPTETENFVMNTDESSWGLNTGKSYITLKEIAN